MPKSRLTDIDHSSGVSLLLFNKSYRYWLLVQRYWWVLGLVLLVCLWGKLYFVDKKPTEYVSRARMMVSARLSLPEGVAYSEELANFFGTQIEIMRSIEVQQGAKKRLERENPGLRAEVSVAAVQVPRTSIFELTAQGGDAEYTRLFLNALMDEFIGFKRDKRQETSFAAISQLTAELARLKREQEEQQSALFDFKKQYNVSYWEAQGNAGTQYLGDLKAQEAKLKTQLRFLESLHLPGISARGAAADSGATGGVQADRMTEQGPEALSSVLQLDGTDTQGVANFLEELPVNEVFRKEYFDTQKQLLRAQIVLDDLLRVLKADHPKVQAVQEDISKLQGFLNLLLYRNLEAAQSNVAVLYKQLETLQSTIREWEESVLQSSQIQAQYEFLAMSLERTKNLYSSLLTTIQKLEVTENVNVETIQILQHATPAYKASKSWVLGVLEGGLLGVLAGVIFIVLMDVLDDRIVSSLDIESAFNEPLLTQIPELDLTGEEGPTPILQPNEKRLQFAEAYRNLRSSILFKQETSQLKTLAICSSSPGEGKSSVAANLAITLSQTGERVLLIDGDLRRGNLSKVLKFDNLPGLSEAMDDIGQWTQYTYSTAYPNLTILPLGQHPAQPGELFLRPHLDTLLAQAQAQYDRIVFDSAPILAVTDSLGLAPKMDAVLMVVRAKITSREKAKQSLSTLEARQARVFGLIMNGVAAMAPGYGYYRYKNYYY
jgi:capsular exopolysaccharide synthesis family protein